MAYDPMLAKVIVKAHDRQTAIRRMHRALEELNVSGVRISAPAAIAVLEEEAFQKGDFDTHFLESLDLSKPRGKEEQLAAAVAAIYRRHRAADKALAGSGETRRGWRERSRSMTSSYSQAATHKSGGGEA
jgi:acetyl/propionyl-CoA carboxylase alpha subunit